jgi:cytidylate kinase
MESGEYKIYNYNNKFIKRHNRIQIHFNDWIFSKQIESFDQNNIIISNQIRKYGLRCIPKTDMDIFLGIGGEYYIYWPFIKNVKRYIGISDHQSIITDANYNIRYSSNYLVDYNNLSTYPIIRNAQIILLNVFQINNNIIKYINSINFDKLIIISCNLPNSKLLLIIKYFIIKNIKYFNNFRGFIRIIELEKK